MGRLVELEAVTENFWETYPSLSLVGPFKELHKKDKTPNKARTSKIMWCVALIWDRDSKYFRLPEDGPDSKVTLVFEDFLGDKSYWEKNRKTVLELKDFYLKLQETTARRSLREIEDKLIQRAEFLKKTDYELGVCNERGSWVGNTATFLDKMLADTKKIYEFYEVALNAVSQENLSEQTKGGGKESLSDSGKI